MYERDNIGKFAPGTKGGPGRKALSPKIKEARKYCQEEFETTVSHFFEIPTREAVEIIKHPETPLIKALIGKCLLEAVKKGDHAKLGFFLDRILGKPNQPVSLTGSLHAVIMQAADQIESDASIS